MGCCECQRIMLMMEVQVASAGVEICGYAKYVAAVLDSWWKDATDNYSTGGSCVYPSAEGLITPGGTCSTGSPTCSGDTSGFITGTTYTNQITGSFSKAVTDLAGASWSAATTYGPILNKVHEDWYLQADPFAANLDVLGLNTTPGAAAADLFDDLDTPDYLTKIRMRFKNTGFPVRLKIEVEKKSYNRDTLAETARATDSVVLTTKDVWSSYIELQPATANTGMVIDRSRVYVPYTA